MRYLGIDLGDKRTGLALGDTILFLAAPLDVVEVPVSRREGEDLLDHLARVIREHAPAGLVVGLPLNMDGSLGPRAKLVEALAKRLGERTRVPVHMQDERLSSAQADWQMARTGLTRQQKKARRDALAAAAILQDFLNARRAPAAPPDHG